MGKPVRTRRMNMVFVHSCGYEVGYATRLPITHGLCCRRCDPDYEQPGPMDWRIVMTDDPDAQEVANRWND